MLELSMARKRLLEKLYDSLERPKDDPNLGHLLNTLENRTLDLQKNLALTRNLYRTFLRTAAHPLDIQFAPDK